MRKSPGSREIEELKKNRDWESQSEVTDFGMLVSCFFLLREGVFLMKRECRADMKSSVCNAYAEERLV